MSIRSLEMNILRFLLVLVALTNCSDCDAHRSCPQLKSCTCLKTSHYKVNISCRDTKVNITDVCRICKTIKHVWRLDLSQNELKHIPASCFKDCFEMEELILASNKLSELEKPAFNGLLNLKRLYLDNNTLISDGEVYDPNLFVPLSNLQLLSIRWTVKMVSGTKMMSYLSNVANDSLAQLRSLYLDGLPGTKFGPNFLCFKNLRYISFSGETSYCNMNSLTKLTFENVPYTETLIISHCNISGVEAESFESLKEIRLLNISYNMALGFPSLRNVSYGLRFSRKLEVLDYSKVYKTFGITTQLNRCDVWFLQNTTLKEIRLNSNRLSAIEINALHVMPPTLEVVYLEDNQITFGPYVLQISCIPNLKRLELNRQESTHRVAAYNEEIYIQENRDDTSGGCPVDRGHLKPSCPLSKRTPLNWGKFKIPSSLKHISARNSNLRYQATNVRLRFKSNIESIDLSNNVIYSWTDPLILFYSLKHLNLSNNFCSNISGQFFLNCPNIIRLDASHNKIGPIVAKDEHGSIFQFLKSLRTLDISSNMIERLPENIFIYSGSLENLDLSFNQIENISFIFDHMRNLSTLLLRQNKITTLPVKLLKQMSDHSKLGRKNVTIDLSENSLDASDCDNVEFLSWLTTHQDVFTNIKSYTFHTSTQGKLSYPDFLKVFGHIQRDCNHKNYYGLIAAASCFIVISIAVILGSILYRYRWRLRYFYYMTKARYNGYIPVRNTDDNIEYRYDVFISYATENYQFVTGEMFNKLNATGLSMCLHQKDFLPGNPIAENIVQAIRNSRLTLIVLSPYFIESKWCIYEFNMARMESIYSREGENVVFVVMYENVDLTKLTLEMRDYLETESYLSFPRDEAEKGYFWQILTQRLRNPFNGNSLR